MKRFEFSLEKVRQFRDEQANLEELKLHNIYAEVRAIDAQRRAVTAELANADRKIREQTSIDAEDLGSLGKFHEFTRNRLKQLAGKRSQCETRAHEQRQRVIEARRQFELLERLKKKAIVVWQAARDKEEEELAAELFLGKRKRDRV